MKIVWEGGGCARVQDMCAVSGHSSDQYIVSKSVKPVSAAADSLPLIRPSGAARSFGRDCGPTFVTEASLSGVLGVQYWI